MGTEDTSAESHLFLLRVWGGGEANKVNGWQGKVQPVVNGKGQYFQDWPSLIELLLEMLPGVESAHISSGSDTGEHE